MKYWWVLVLIAILLFIPGLIFTIFAVDMWYEEPEKDDPSTPDTDESTDPHLSGCLAFSLCVPIFWLPALVLIVMAVHGFKEQSRLSQMADVMHAHDALHADTAAEAMEITPSQAKRLMSKCIKKDLVQGRMRDDTYYSPRHLKRTEYLTDMADILKAYRRVSIADFAKRIGVNEPEAERVILECLEDRLIFGYISRRSRTFFTREYLDQIENVQIGWKCESCGSHNQEIILPGEVDICPYCGSMSRVKGVGSKNASIEAIEL